jgi:hypothetical protein
MDNVHLRNITKLKKRNTVLAASTLIIFFSEMLKFTSKTIQDFLRWDVWSCCVGSTFGTASSTSDVNQE